MRTSCACPQLVHVLVTIHSVCMDVLLFLNLCGYWALLKVASSAGACLGRLQERGSNKFHATTAKKGAITNTCPLRGKPLKVNRSTILWSAACGLRRWR